MRDLILDYFSLFSTQNAPRKRGKANKAKILDLSHVNLWI
jgi:hypothetical protein